MEKRKKWIVAILICSLLITITLGATLITKWLSTTTILVVPDDIEVSPMSWSWGTLIMLGEQAVSTQDVQVTNLGAIPYTLTATPDEASMVPAWFTSDYYQLTWTAYGYELQPRETITTTFTFTVDVSVARNYMIDHQIPEVEVSFNIIVTGSDIPLPQYTLEITTTLGGTTDPAPGIYNYSGTIDVTAIPDAGYQFDYWLLDDMEDLNNPISVMMDANHSLNVVFKEALPIICVDPEYNDYAVGSTFTINISVIDVTDIYAWNVAVGFDPLLLNCTNAWYPSDHVFAGKTFVPVSPIIENDMGYVLHGCCLMESSSGEGFTGSGTLFQIEFEVLSTGNCILQFDGVETYLMDFDDKITVTLQEGYFDNS